MSAHIILITALSLIIGVFGARLFKNLKIPQVVGYIVIGLILGVSGFNLVTEKIVMDFAPLNYIALGIIGFLVGGELKASVFKKFGKTLIIILLFEGLFAFIFVTLIVYFFTHNFPMAIILGALASATAPAATVDVLWEYKAAGSLTTFVFAIVALDDGLALLLYSFAKSTAKMLIKHQGITLYSTVLLPLYQIIGAFILGAGIAFFYKWVLDFTAKYKHEKDLLLSFTFGSILLIVAVAKLLDFDLILAEMFFGVTFVNIAPKYSEKVFDLMKEFSPPIYLLFFILAGARLNFQKINLYIVIIAVLYVIARTLGKNIGPFLAAKITKAPDKIAKYMGLCLFSQAGVTIGLAISTYNKFPTIGFTVLNVVTVSTFIVQIIGPPFVKYAITKADETYKKISDEEILEKIKIKESIDSNPHLIPYNYTLPQILKEVALSNYDEYYVVDENDNVIGSFDLSTLKPLIYENDELTANLIIAQDITSPIIHKIKITDNLKTAYNIMLTYNLKILPVVDEKNDLKIIGVISMQNIKSLLKNATLKLKESF